MTGQYIQLDGVTIPAGYNPPRITMSEADIIAASMPSLEYAMSPQELSSSVTGFDRVRGVPILTFGANAANLQLRTAGGHLGIGSSSPTASAGSAAITESKIRDSVCFVQAVYASSASNSANTLATSPAFGAFTLLRVSENTEDPSLATLGVLPPSASHVRQVTNNSWHIICASNSANGQWSTVDGGAWVNTTSSGFSYLGEDWMYEFGYRASTGGLRNSLAGHTYIFSEELAATEAGRSRLMELVNALKAQYGVP